MLKQIECRIVESRPLEPCRAISHRQSENNRPDNFARPPHPAFREKVQTARRGFFTKELKKHLQEQNSYPLGLMMDIFA
jgi:hypothetical protein